MAPEGRAVVRVEGLRVWFDNGRERLEAVRGIDFTLEPGKCLAIVGESGSGKSATARALLGLARHQATRLELAGEDLNGLGEREWRRVRGRRIGLVFQDALAALDPLRTIGAEITEAVRNHAETRSARARAGDRVVPLLTRVRMPDPGIRAGLRPFQLSGGQRQRALIASAIAADPEVLVADEPTTALDPSVQARILELLEAYVAAGNSLLLISHDLAVVARLADHIAVMHQGLFVESGPAAEVLAAPSHPYTARLRAATPGKHSRGRRLAAGRPYVPGGSPAHSCSYAAGCQLADDLCRTTCPPRIALAAGHDAWCWRTDEMWPAPAPPAPEVRRPAADVVVDVRGVSKTFHGPGSTRHTAVRDVSFEVRAGETLGVVGESGSGKTTLARLLLGLVEPDEGEIRLLGEAWSGRSESVRRPLRGRVQFVQQDPLASFDPRLTVSRIVGEALGKPGRGGRRRHDDRVAELLGLVGLGTTVLGRLPRELSGGQQQRVAIARALATGPEVVVCDEPVSALDVSSQAQVLDLFADLRERLAVALVFISHDFGVINHISDRVVVLHQGEVVETGATEQVLSTPRHAYTRTLLDAVPEPAGSRCRPASRKDRP